MNKMIERVILRKVRFKIVWMSIAAMISYNLAAQPVAFPGAEGFGKWASGGRGGEVVAVTNLLDDPANPPEGSFRWAIEQAYETIQHPQLPIMIEVALPITIVFKVSGIIELQDELSVARSNITIAGQTAPGDGICFKGDYFTLFGENIILRYLRFRPGLDIDPDDLATGVAGLGVENCRNVIVDHCSFSWANEECAIFYDNKYTTVQWCIASEGLYDAGHQKGARSYGGVWGGKYASIHHNLIAHNRSRTIRFNGARAHDTTALVDYRNNVIYNWNSNGSCYGGEVQIRKGYSEVNMVANYYKPGPARPGSLYFVSPGYSTSDAGVGRWYIDGNVMDGNSVITADNWLGVDKSDISGVINQAKSLTPFRMAEPLPTQSAEDAFAEVLAKVGAAFPRDTIDKRIVHETSTGTAIGTGVIGNGIIDDPAVVGGYPTYETYDVPEDQDEDGMDDAWELSNGLSPSDREDRNNLNEEGYTMLEVYMNSLVEDLTLISSPVVHVKGIDRNYCAGGDPDLLFGSPLGGTFTAGEGFTIVGGDSVIFDPSEAMDYQLKYVYDDGNGYTDSITEIINVHELPDASINGLDPSYTAAQSFVTLTGSPGGGAFLTADGIQNPGYDEALFSLQDTGEYTVYYYYKNSYGCIDTAMAETVIHTGTSARDIIAADKYRIYPNPVSDQFSLISDRPVQKIKIYNTSGILIRVIKEPDISVIEFSKEEKGIYYLFIYDESEVTVKRIAKI